MIKPTLLTGTASVTALIAIANPALSQAQTTVTGESGTPLTTSTAGNVVLKPEAELEVNTPVAITINSNNDVTIETDEEGDDEDTLDSDDDVERGRLTAGEVNGAVGIRINAGVTTTITVEGDIILDEDFTPEDDDNNGVADGVIAERSGRYGIYVAPGAATRLNLALEDGLIRVEGLNSGGIVVDSNLSGNFAKEGTVQVYGDNGIGVRLQDVAGDVVMNGLTQVVGRGSTAFRAEGDIAGILRVQGSIEQGTTFTYDTETGAAITLSRFDLRIEAPAAVVAGNVAGGIILARTPDIDIDDDDDDEDDDGIKDEDDDDFDNDGIDDADEGTGGIYSYGNGPALQIGGIDDIAIGILPPNADNSPMLGGNYSLLIEGTISGTATFGRTDAYGLVLGGEGGNVNLPGGIGISGSVRASTADSAATALLINAGTTVGRIDNSGTIQADIRSQGEGAAYGIRDLSGSLTYIENTGFISASGSSTDIAQAIDLSRTSSDVTITQYINADDLETREEIEEDLDDDEEDATVYTAITGDIVTGSGNDRLAASGGQIVGDVFFNAGNDRLELSDEVVMAGDVFFGAGTGTISLAGDAEYYGTVDFAGNGGSITINDAGQFFGAVTNGRAASVVVNSGTFGANEVSTSTIGSLTVGANGELKAYIDGDTQESSLIIANSARFDPGATISATVTTLVGAEGRYTILRADSLVGNPTFDAETTNLPFIFAGDVDIVGGEVILDIRRKEAIELGVRGSATNAYDAILTAAIEDDTIAQSFLEIEDGATLQAQLDQMLPDHAGGLLDAATTGTRLAARNLMDRDSIFKVTEKGDRAAWVQPLYWKGNRDAGANVGYDHSGSGVTLGMEWRTNLGYLGGSYSFITGKVQNNPVEDDGPTQTINTTQHDLGLFWRTADTGPIHAFARLGGAYTGYSSARNLTVTINDDTDIAYQSEGDWNGWLLSAMAGASYNWQPSKQLTIRPRNVIEWFQLRESGYEEDGGNLATDLIVDSRTSSSLAVHNSLNITWSISPRERDYRPITFEFGAGRRTILSGDTGRTTANYEDGERFTIDPAKLQSAWTGEAAVFAGGWDFTWKLGVSAEKPKQGDINYSARASLSVAF
ncbi:MAG: autotransporter domain-containing protein [Sphingopyxis sp.]|nr:autotransporter domain-containing protein [Sphingopyxis sp.]